MRKNLIRIPIMIMGIGMIIMSTACGGSSSGNNGGGGDNDDQYSSICTWKDNKECAYTPTFDDGIYNSLVAIEPKLQDHNLVATIALISNWINNGANLEGYSIGSWAQYKTLLDNGSFTIASHTANHKNLTSLSAADMDTEFDSSITDIETNTGHKPLVLFYPLSRTNETVEAEAAKYFIGARSSHENENDYDTTANYDIDSYPTVASTTVAQMNGWVDKGITNNAWVVVCSHGVDGEAYEPTPLATFDSHWGYVESKISQIWNAGFDVVYKYKNERQSSTVKTVSHADSGIVINLTDTLDNTIYNEPLTLKTIAPATWATATVTQGETTSTVNVIDEGENNYIYYNALPDAGKISIVKKSSVEAAPEIPAGLTAAATSTKQINITWTDSISATSYDLTVDGTIITGVTSPYIHSGLEANSAHTYKVRAVNSAGSSDWSAEADATTNPITIASIPINVKALAAGPTLINVTWYTSDGATSYDVLVDGTTTVTDITTTSYANSGLLVDTTHTYKIRAVNSAGASGWSDEVSATTRNNLISNGGFEDGTMTPLAIDTGGAITDPVSVVNDAANSHAGSYSLRIKNLQGTDESTYCAFLELHGLTAGASYTFSFYTKVDAGASYSATLFYLTSWAGGPVDNTVITDNGTWILHTISLTIPTGDDGFVIYIANADNAHLTTDHFIYLDDFSLIPE